MIPSAMLPGPTRDRADIIHLAGRLRLSPALREGAPALVQVGDPGGRCGWEPFFAALECRGLWVTAGDGPTVLIGRERPGP